MVECLKCGVLKGAMKLLWVGIWVGGRSEVCLFRSGALTLSGPEHGEAEIDSGFRSDSWPGGSDRVGKGRYKCTEESRGEGEA